jgi:uncharacterized protein HemX
VIASLVAGIGYAGWWYWNQRLSMSERIDQQQALIGKLDADIKALQGDTAELGDRHAELSRTATRTGTDLASALGRIEESQRLMSRLSEELAGGRTRFELASVEHLLLLASDRLQLEHDAEAAAKALDSAERRLAQMGDPSLFSIREALVTERTALLAVPKVDLSSAALVLGALIDRVSRLPLRAHAPAHFESPALRLSGETHGEDTRWWQRLWVSVRSALGSLFTIRRDDNAASLRLLPTDQEALVYYALSLKLEAARVALLSRDTTAFREELRSALNWLEQHFRADDAGVMATTAELERLQQMELSPPLPEIGRGLTLLRARLEAAPR